MQVKILMEDLIIAPITGAELAPLRCGLYNSSVYVWRIPFSAAKLSIMKDIICNELAKDIGGFYSLMFIVTITNLSSDSSTFNIREYSFSSPTVSSAIFPVPGRGNSNAPVNSRHNYVL